MEKSRYAGYEPFLLDTEDYSWAFLMTGYIRDKGFDTIYPERPRLKHIGVKGTTANDFFNKRFELLAYTDMVEVL